MASDPKLVETSQSYADRVGVTTVLEEFALKLLQARPEDPRTYLAAEKNKAAQTYPAGNKSEATATCLCGGVEIKIKAEQPLMSIFCHCVACRRFHSAPFYQIMYFGSANVDCKTLKPTAGTDAAITVTQGLDLLVRSEGGPGNPNYRTVEDHPMFGGVGRTRCKECGVAMMNAIFLRPQTTLNESEEEVPMFGIFPGTLTEKMGTFTPAWQPQFHIHCESAVVPVAFINDGLPKFATWPGGEEIA